MKICPLSIVGNNEYHYCAGVDCMLWSHGDCCLKSFLLGLVPDNDTKPDDKEIA